MTNPRLTKILVVDDDPRALHYMHYVLKSAGHDVLSAGHPEEALKLVQDVSDLAVLFADYRMPVMKGTVLAKRLKARLPGLAVVFVSGEPDQLRQDRDLPPDAICVAKPATAAELLEAVNAALSSQAG